MQIIKRITDKAVTAISIIAITVAMAVCALSISFGIAKADGSNDLTEYVATSLDIGNPQFTNSSGSYPATPDNWTGAYLGNGSGSIVAGVIDLSASAYNSEGDDDKKGNKKYELDQYPEFEDGKIPQTPFGSDKYANTDAKTLLINTPEGAETAYAYTSSDMTFAPDSFYRVSAWIKTGDFASNTGATIKLTGLGTDCSFHNINTKRSTEDIDKTNDYGWQKYTFYVRTGMSVSRTVNLVLGLGDVANGNDEDPVTAPNPAHGYAFFDNVEAERISPEQYAHITKGFSSTERDNVYTDVTGRSMVLDLNDAEFLLNDYSDPENALEIGSFTDVTLDNFDNSTGWQRGISHESNENGIYGGSANAFIYNAYLKNDVTADDEGNVANVYGMTQNPWTPFGKAETVSNDNDSYAPFDSSNEILAISTYSRGSFDSACLGVASPDVTIERYGYYRFGVWVKGDNVTGGNGISVGVVGECNNTGNDNKLHQRYNNLEGDTSDTAHYGWKEHVVYIRGSMLSDLTVHFELWLGAPNQKSSGIAYFDNVTFKKLTYSEYSTLSGADGGNVLTLDGISSDTGISNGNLMSIGDFDELEYPLPAAEWTYGTANTAETTGFSTAEVNSDNVVYGILPVDDETFNGIKSEGKLPGISSPKMFANAPLYNSLILSSSTKTAAFYRTASMTASAGTGYKVTADIAVDKVTDGYGASLVLKAGNSVISTIEGIKSTHNAFKRFTFYVDAPVSDQSLNLEIWLGLNDRNDNTQKLSNGNIYVKSVGLETWEVGEDTTVAQEYAAIAEKYAADIKIPSVLTNLDYGVYSFNAPNLDYYDAYSYYLNGGYAVPYQWTVSTAKDRNTVKGGLFDPDVTEIYNGFEKKDQTGNMLLIYNTLPNRATYTYANSIPLDANTYYRLDVTVKLRLSEEERDNKQSVGANIKLTGTNEQTFENIKDTSTLVMPNHEDSRDYETFKTYTFFISAGADGGNIGLEISLGGNDITSYIQGMLVVSDIKLTSINNTTFETATAEENLIEEYQKAVKLSETAEDDETDTEAPSNDLAWWVIPTIIFSACLVAAIILIVVMRLKDVVKRKKKKTFKTDYDRNDVLKKIDELSKTEEPDEQKAVDDLSDEFDGESAVKEEPEEIASDAAADNETENTEETIEEKEEVVKPEKPDAAEDLDD